MRAASPVAEVAQAVDIWLQEGFHEEGTSGQKIRFTDEEKKC